MEDASSFHHMLTTMLSTYRCPVARIERSEAREALKAKPRTRDKPVQEACRQAAVEEHRRQAGSYAERPERGVVLEG